MCVFVCMCVCVCVCFYPSPSSSLLLSLLFFNAMSRGKEFNIGADLGA